MIVKNDKITSVQLGKFWCCHIWNSNTVLNLFFNGPWNWMKMGPLSKKCIYLFISEKNKLKSNTCKHIHGILSSTSCIGVRLEWWIFKSSFRLLMFYYVMNMVVQYCTSFARQRAKNMKHTQWKLLITCWRMPNKFVIPPNEKPLKVKLRYLIFGFFRYQWITHGFLLCLIKWEWLGWIPDWVSIPKIMGILQKLIYIQKKMDQNLEAWSVLQKWARKIYIREIFYLWGLCVQ